MNKRWSQFVQTSEEMYRSRALRFHDGNKELWLKALQLENGMRVLEVGCGGGIFCHRIKTYLPDTEVTGLDFDIGHIEFAKAKTVELGLDCKFINGDATKLPFDDNSFDLCYSYTVIEHIPTEQFLSEQFRVLKPNGKIVVLSVRSNMGLSNNNNFLVSEEEKEKELFQKAWEKAGDFDKENGIGVYELEEHDFPKVLERAGFKAINIDFFTVSNYCPDNTSISCGMAIEQINVNRLHTLASVEKALRINPDGLTDTEKKKLFDMINKRYDARLEQYKSGEKQWDFMASTTLVASGIK